jgi:hypothetical protein
MTEADIKNIEKRIYIKIKFNNEKIGYNKLSIPEKIEFISKVVSENLNKISKTLKIFGNIKFEYETPYKNILFFTVYTLPKRNHPIIGYVFKNNTANEITLIRPIGKNKYNLNIDHLDIYLNRHDFIYLTEIYALYLSIIKSIIIRKEELVINPEFSLLNCYNIKGCITATKKATNSNNKTKKEIIENYRRKGILVIKNYFAALESYNFTKAESILGTTKMANSEINTIFRKKKSIRGHLEIFITLYKLIKTIKDKYTETEKKYKNYVKSLENKKSNPITVSS